MDWKATIHRRNRFFFPFFQVILQFHRILKWESVGITSALQRRIKVTLCSQSIFNMDWVFIYSIYCKKKLPLYFIPCGFPKLFYYIQRYEWKINWTRFDENALSTLRREIPTKSASYRVCKLFPTISFTFSYCMVTSAIYSLKSFTIVLCKHSREYADKIRRAITMSHKKRWVSQKFSC